MKDPAMHATMAIGSRINSSFMTNLTKAIVIVTLRLIRIFWTGTLAAAIVMATARYGAATPENAEIAAEAEKF